MKVFLALAFIAAVSCTPYYNSEEYSDFQDDLALGFIGSESQSSSFESYELALAGSGDWRQTATDHMNMLRAKASLPPLTLDAKLNQGSQKWAEYLQCASSGKHDTGVVENLASVNMGTTPTQDEMATDGINRWYNEYMKFDCSRPIISSKLDSYYSSVGHYLNVMSTRYNAVGFGLSLCPGKKTGYLVARFNGDADGLFKRKYKEELTSQGLTYPTQGQLDISKSAPCPTSFNP